jgi:hypothetical protein
VLNAVAHRESRAVGYIVIYLAGFCCASAVFWFPRASVPPPSVAPDPASAPLLPLTKSSPQAPDPFTYAFIVRCDAGHEDVANATRARLVYPTGRSSWAGGCAYPSTGNDGNNVRSKEEQLGLWWPVWSITGFFVMLFVCVFVVPMILGANKVQSCRVAVGISLCVMCPLLLIFVTVAAYGFLSAPDIDRCWPTDATASDIAALSKGAYIDLDPAAASNDFAWARQVMRYCAGQSGFVLEGDLDQQGAASTARLYLPLRSSSLVAAKFAHLDAFVLRFMFAAVGLTLTSIVGFWLDLLLLCSCNAWHAKVLRAEANHTARVRQSRTRAASATDGSFRGVQVQPASPVPWVLVSAGPWAASAPSAPGGPPSSATTSSSDVSSATTSSSDVSV